MSRLVTGAGGRPSSWYPHLAATQSPALYKTGRGSLHASCLSPLQATFRNVIPGGAHTFTDPQTSMHALCWMYNVNDYFMMKKNSSSSSEFNLISLPVKRLTWKPLKIWSNINMWNLFTWYCTIYIKYRQLPHHVIHQDSIRHDASQYCNLTATNSISPAL